ncbi:MAG: 50S ribosomal protein L11 methyltransferase, partial [Euzebya sp.]
MDRLSDALVLAGIDCLGLSEDDGIATAWFALRPDHDLPLPGRWEEVDDHDWSQRWKQGLQPVTVGRITVTLPWLAPAGPQTHPDGSITLVIEPGLAFGTGHHETTNGCLAALQRQPPAGCEVTDIGPGPGV